MFAKLEKSLLLQQESLNEFNERLRNDSRANILLLIGSIILTAVSVVAFISRLRN